MKVVTFPEEFRREADLVALIAPNGAGHHKRVFGAMDLILQSKPQTKVAIFADQNMTERFLRDFEPLQRIAANDNVTFLYGVVSPGMDIMAKDPTIYINGQWLDWINRLIPYLDLITNAKVVWADALPLLLMFRSDTIFSSSFTFGPIIFERWGRDNKLGGIAWRYADQEEWLMKKYKPIYICPKIFAMDFMYERARLKEVGIMADFQPLPKVKTARPTIGFSGGLTGLAGEILGQAIRILLSDGRFDLIVDDKIKEKFPDIPLFENEAAAYAPLSACVIRPGVGSSTNCITSATPIIAISEPDLEMENNGERLQRYGLGIKIRKAEEVIPALEKILTPEWQKSYAIAHSQTSLNGLQELANEIITRL